MKEEIIEFYIKEIETELNVDLFKYRTKTNDMVFARAVAYCIFHEGFGMNWTEIGKIFKKNHATVIHSVNNIVPYIKTVDKYRRVLDRLLIYVPMHRRANKEVVIDTDVQSRHEISKLLILNDKLKLDNSILHEEIGKIHAELENYRKGQQLLSILKGVPEDKMPLVEERLSAMVRML
jgi:hypothetical protein